MNPILPLFLAALLSSPILPAKTLHSQMIARVQRVHAERFSERPIVMMDIDELEYRYALAGAFGSEPLAEKKRLQIIQEYVAKQAALRPTLEDAKKLEYYTHDQKGMASSLIIEGMCAVFTASPNLNERLELERRLQLNVPGIHSNLTWTGIKHRASLKTMQLFSIYHELGHCVDRTYLPDAIISQDILMEDGSLARMAHAIHLSEVFAESVAMILTFTENKDDGWELAKTFAHYRNIYTWAFGQWAMDNPPSSFAPLFPYSGAIYHLAPTLLSMQKLFHSNNSSAFDADHLDHIIAAAEKTVETHALSLTGIEIITRYFRDGFEKTVAAYRPLNLKRYAHLNKGYEEFLSFVNLAPILYDLATDEGVPPPFVTDTGQNLPPISDHELCSAKNKGEWSDKLNQWRAQLQAGGSTYFSELRRKRELDDIHRRYSQCPHIILARQRDISP